MRRPEDHCPGNAAASDVIPDISITKHIMLMATAKAAAPTAAASAFRASVQVHQVLMKQGRNRWRRRCAALYPDVPPRSGGCRCVTDGEKGRGGEGPSWLQVLLISPSPTPPCVLRDGPSVQMKCS